MNLSRGTGDLYSLARLANKARVVGALAKGNVKPALHYIKNRILFMVLGPLIRK